MTPVAYEQAITQERADDPAFDLFVKLRFGGDMLTLAQSWFSMTEAERAAWIAANPELWARLQAYLIFLTGQLGRVTDYARLVASIPPGLQMGAPPVPLSTSSPA